MDANWTANLESFFQAADRAQRRQRPPRPPIYQIAGKRRRQRRQYKVAMALCFAPGELSWMHFVHDEVILSATAAHIWRKHSMHEFVRAMRYPSRPTGRLCSSGRPNPQNIKKASKVTP